MDKSKLNDKNANEVNNSFFNINEDDMRLSDNGDQKKITVIGCGRWGTFIAWYLDKIGHKVSLYGRKTSSNMKKLMETRSNSYLELPESLNLTYDINEVKNSDIIVISISSQKLESLGEQLNNLNVKDKTIVLCMKGIEIESGRRLTQIIEDTMDNSNKVAVWLGPGHVQEFYRGIPNCMVIDSKYDDIKKELVDSFSSKLIRFYYGTDLIGNEIGGAAKNVVGIAAGILDGLGLSTLKGALMARGTREIGRLIKAMGGNENSVYSLCHLGDYEATVFSQFSQNRTYGMNLVLGKDYEKLAEGYYTVKALRNLGEKYKVDLPICEAVYQVLYCDAKPEETIDNLFLRSIKSEF